MDMGVENDGSGPATGPNEASSDSPSMAPFPPSLARDSNNASPPSALKQSTSSASPVLPAKLVNGSTSATNSKGGLPHPFHPSNLPEQLPTLTPPSPLPQKRHSPEDFTPSEVKEKKAVRFESSVVGGGGETDEARDKREEIEKAKKKKRRDATERAVSTFAMLGGFFGQFTPCLPVW